jgi:ankyrin repeat protein
VKEHIAEGAPLDESDHCGDPPMLLAAGNGHTAVCDLLINEVRAI